MTDWLVQLTQGTMGLYITAKGNQWAYTLAEAGHFSYKDALSRARKQRTRFDHIMNPQAPPPAGLVTIKLLEVDGTGNVVSEQIIT